VPNKLFSSSVTIIWITAGHHQTTTNICNKKDFRIKTAFIDLFFIDSFIRYSYFLYLCTPVVAGQLGGVSHYIVYLKARKLDLNKETLSKDCLLLGVYSLHIIYWSLFVTHLFIVSRIQSRVHGR
jgi:hypothetical protein